MSKFYLSISRLLALGGVTAVTGTVYNTFYKENAECRPATFQDINHHPNTPASESNHVSRWDDNWDFRKTNASSLGDKSAASSEKSSKPTATRHIILIRHGQYVHADDDKERVLTELGRQQASITGERIKSLNIKWDKLIVSTMTRAQETANLIATSVPEVSRTECSLLREGPPYPTDPPSRTKRPEHHIFQENPRIEAAFRKYIHRAPPEQLEDSYELIVCHANVIRYFVCRALQFPPEGWLRMSIPNCGLTWLCVRPSGNVSLRSLGNAGHLPPDLLTTR